MGQQAEVASGRAKLKQRQGTSLARSQTRLAWLLLAPTLIIIGIVAAWPLVDTVYLSFTDSNLTSVTPPQFIGLQNYQRLIHDTIWWSSVVNTLVFWVITVIVEMILGTVIALVINSQFKGRGMMRAAMLVPWAIPTVISAQMWKWMYNDVYGVVKDLFAYKIPILPHNIAFLSNKVEALPAIAAVDIWKTTPFVALLLLAGLQVIPGDVYEAATVDGASWWQTFWRVTVPLLRPAIAVTLIFRTLDALRVFDVFYVMFGNRTDTSTMAIYDQINIVNYSQLGYGAAISVFIFIVIGIFVVAYVTTLGVEGES